MPVKSPSGMPPVQTIRVGASSAVTFTGNERPGLPVTETVTFCPSATVPSVAVTVVFHDGQAARSVRMAQTVSAGAAMVVRVE